MTGHGEASGHDELHTYSIEIRTVNNRYLKTSIRLNDGFGSLEPKVEDLIKKSVKRGSVYAAIKIGRRASANDYRLNDVVLKSYRDQLRNLFPDATESEFRPELLLTLPGVIETNREEDDSALEELWTTLLPCLQTALERLGDMRRREGAAMADDLRRNCSIVADEVAIVAQRAPEVVANYQDRLTERLNQLLAPHEINVEPRDIAREVGMFADRCDISEEIVRLRSHLEQFDKILSESDGAGKKLDFLTQEMFREVNTIGSKANDAEIAQHVIQMKAAIERIREMTQNLE